MPLLSGATNWAVSAVATAPSPATSGTSVTVTTGHGTRFPDPAAVGSYPVAFAPAATVPDPSNAEVVTVTAKSGDVLTIVRAQEGSTARSVGVGDQVFAPVTAGLWNSTSAAAVAAMYASEVGR